MPIISLKVHVWLRLKLNSCVKSWYRLCWGCSWGCQKLIWSVICHFQPLWPCSIIFNLILHSKWIILRAGAEWWFWYTSVQSHLILHQVVHVRQTHHLHTLLHFFIVVSWSNQTPKLCQSSVHHLLWCSILAIVDVEADRAGEGEGQVGDDGHHVHPWGPRYLLGWTSLDSLQKEH